MPDDPLFQSQWGLLNTGQAGGKSGVDVNVLPVWPDYTGNSVRVAVIDSGVQLDHPDLAANVDIQDSYNAGDDAAGGGPVVTTDNHGTSVAGIIAAVANDGLGGVGVAPDATLISLRIATGTAPAGKGGVTVALQHALAANADVVNNSWGTETPFEITPAQLAALHAMVDQGRGGLGTIVIFASGDSGYLGDDSILSSWRDDPGVIAVAAINNDGTPGSYLPANGHAKLYTTPGANVLVSAPGGMTGQSVAEPGAAIVTTDRTGADGANPAASPAGDYRFNFNGTSASAPFVSGVVALMLEANPGLGYRDVQEILAKSASIVDAASSTWTTIHSDDWNGGGSEFSNTFGFGLVDAHAAVRLAETYVGRTPQASANAFAATEVTSLAAPMTLGQTTTTESLSFKPGGKVERVDLTLGMDVADISSLVVKLVGPTGTQITLLDHAQNQASDGGIASWSGQHTLSTDAFWGEAGGGIWKVQITSDSNGNTLSAVSLNLTEVLHSVQNLREIYYTDDFSELARSDISRLVISQPTGDTRSVVINAAPVSTGLTVDLAHHYMLIEGYAVTIPTGMTVATIYAGDGNDTLVGGASDITFLPGRGDNTVIGGGGTNTLQLLRVIADYTEAVHGSHFVLTGSESRDNFSGVSKLQFTDGVVTLGSDPLINDIYYAQHNSDVYAAGVAANAHYDQFGWHEGRDPNGSFSTLAYLAANPDVAAAGVNPLTHYDQSGWHEGRDPSAGFSTSLYLERNPDVAAADMDPLLHYLEYGIAEGREAIPVVESAALQGAFDPTYYRMANPDVTVSGMDPLTHWQQFGQAEHRNPNAFFDTSYYLAHNPDVAAAGVDPLIHYLTFGWREGRDPSSHFNTAAYVDHYADVAAAGINPLLHFLQFGIYEGRSAFGDSV